MFKIVQKFLVLVSSIFMISTFCLAGEKVVVGIHTAPPVMYQDSSGKFVGSMVDTIHKMLKKAKITDYEMKLLPTKRLYKELGAGNVHIFIEMILKKFVYMHNINKLTSFKN